MAMKVIKNQFSNSQFRYLMKLLCQFKSTTTNRPLLKQQLQGYLQCSSKQCYSYCISTNPTLFIQYQLRSLLILEYESIRIIIWKPKYIQYPLIISFPKMESKKLSNFHIKIDHKYHIQNDRIDDILSFIQNFYGNFFYSDPNFQTNLVTFIKHFITKRTLFNYWHVIMEQHGQALITKLQQAQSLLLVSIKGSSGYHKELIMFSKKGKKNGVFTTAASKWMQLCAFVAMLLIFFSVGCNSISQEGLCIYRNEMLVCGAGIMMGLFGMRIINNSKKKKIKNKKKQ